MPGARRAAKNGRGNARARFCAVNNNIFEGMNAGKIWKKISVLWWLS